MTGRVTNGALSEASIELPASGGADHQLVNSRRDALARQTASQRPGPPHAVSPGGRP